ncbi:type IV toxin-antitoxin system AbiEi family antitoxin domain-containing protein [Gordonia hydrophobica]|uniref:Type IV toxin-antitoxin system AbiEi family antitoxin domain-containing protein n=1 Tax=Gordonia hydrophobica TaxID=40516 RepID=A0ABZ2U4S8_9ACTN|nr:type IV toxin-antitoxin system AbiEi family antitoxin domain-containing protein [Gordonia hydrophobica]MBM7368310.1 hypothetical protein [Gordonia hydrophobica]
MGAPDTAFARLRYLLTRQSGVVAREQVLACGFDSAFIRRRLDRREWLRIYPGVYITHTGPLTWTQRAWSVVLHAEPAALSHGSALRAAAGRPDAFDDAGPIHVTIASGRRFLAKEGMVLHHRANLVDDALMNTAPPRVRVEEAVLDLAAEATTELGMISALADPVQARLTTADRLLGALARRSRIRHRSAISDILIDVRDGSCSTLEHRFLTRVERPHGLPAPARQTPTGVGRPGRRDLEYPEFGLIVELDGRLFHDNALARALDMERDLDANAFADKDSVRLCWVQAAERSCTTALKLGVVLRRHGWTGHPHPCTSPDCAVRNQQCSQ